VRLLVELHLRGDQLGQVAQRLGRVEDLCVGVVWLVYGV
jgi:hypothetical protein